MRPRGGRRVGGARWRPTEAGGVGAEGGGHAGNAGASACLASARAKITRGAACRRRGALLWPSGGGGVRGTRQDAPPRSLFCLVCPLHSATQRSLFLKVGIHKKKHTKDNRGVAPKVNLILLVLWKNGSGFGACTSIDPKLRRRIRGWPSGPQKKKRSAKRSTSHPLMPTSAFVSISGIRSARFSTAPDL